jgi:hypothetical protein
VVTAQPAETDVASPRYSQKTLLRIKHARVTRDTVLSLGGVAWIVYGIVTGDSIWIVGLFVAVIFGIAAFARGSMKPAWDRDWSRSFRCISSIFFLIGGLYFIGYSLVISGHVGMQGSGTAANCTYFDGVTSTSAGKPAWYCDVDVHWSNGTTELKKLRTSDEVRNGDTISYARPPVRYLFLTGDQPVTTASQYAFGILVGLAIFLQASFSLCVLIFGKTPPKTTGE